MVTQISNTTKYKVIFNECIYYITLTESDKNEEILIEDNKGNIIEDNHLWNQIENYFNLIMS
jgi:hypothetical protein